MPLFRVNTISEAIQLIRDALKDFKEGVVWKTFFPYSETHYADKTDTWGQMCVYFSQFMTRRHTSSLWRIVGEPRYFENEYLATGVHFVKSNYSIPEGIS